MLLTTWNSIFLHDISCYYYVEWIETDTIQCFCFLLFLLHFTHDLFFWFPDCHFSHHNGTNAPFLDVSWNAALYIYEDIETAEFSHITVRMYNRSADSQEVFQKFSFFMFYMDIVRLFLPKRDTLNDSEPVEMCQHFWPVKWPRVWLFAYTFLGISKSAESFCWCFLIVKIITRKFREHYRDRFWAPGFLKLTAAY